MNDWKYFGRVVNQKENWQEECKTVAKYSCGI